MTPLLRGLTDLLKTYAVTLRRQRAVVAPDFGGRSGLTCGEIARELIDHDGSMEYIETEEKSQTSVCRTEGEEKLLFQ